MIDSLDKIVFIIELSELTGREYSEDIDLVKAGLLRIANLTDYLTGRKDII